MVVELRTAAVIGQARTTTTREAARLSRDELAARRPGLSYVVRETDGLTTFVPR